MGRPAGEHDGVLNVLIDRLANYMYGDCDGVESELMPGTIGNKQTAVARHRAHGARKGETGGARYRGAGYENDVHKVALSISMADSVLCHITTIAFS